MERTVQIERCEADGAERELARKHTIRFGPTISQNLHIAVRMSYVSDGWSGVWHMYIQTRFSAMAHRNMIERFGHSQPIAFSSDRTGAADGGLTPVALGHKSGTHTLEQTARKLG